MRRFLIGLGNPGEEYAETRHNLGFMIVDRLSGTLSVRLRPGKGEYLIGQRTADGRQQIPDLYLVKPLTFVNRSGIAILDLIEKHEVGVSSILVVCDDADLPFGRIRLRKGGSDGGHKGLQSIIYHLQTEEFSRLRAGIGRPDAEDLTDFVLSRFDSSEMELVEEEIGRASDAALLWALEGIEKAMNAYNADPSDNAADPKSQ